MAKPYVSTSGIKINAAGSCGYNLCDRPYGHSCCAAVAAHLMALDSALTALSLAVQAQGGNSPATLAAISNANTVLADVVPLDPSQSP